MRNEKSKGSKGTGKAGHAKDREEYTVEEKWYYEEMEGILPNPAEGSE